MFTRGEFTTNNVTYGVILKHTKVASEAILITSGTVVSAYKNDITGSYSYNNNKAKELVNLVKAGVKGCTSKNSTPMPFELGAMTQHEFIKTKVEYVMQMYRGEVVGAYIQSDSNKVELTYIPDYNMPEGIPYVKLTEAKKEKELDIAEDDLDSVPVRSVQEIALEKDDLTWLQNKKYFIVNDDATAEQIFDFLDNYNGVIAYDTETTGLRINCFGKINSEYQKTLIKYNEEHPTEQIRADKLVGIIFCVENDTSYYFPCFNRKFKNLYEDLDSPVRQKVINNIKAKYTVGIFKDKQSDMADYIRNTPAEELDLGVILMERVRNILETKHIVAHNGTFEWKVGWQYEIDTNLKDDTMIMHQLMYKFRSTTSNRGEPSNLKYLAKRELGVDQWELGDFFPDWKADTTGTVRTKAGSRGKKGSKIDFSYMDYEGTRIYAPTDGDVTFQLFTMYKRDMITNHKEMEYIYQVEIIVACAIAYMEFYGHRLDESKILNAREQTRANIAEIISEIRQLIDYSTNEEIDAYNKLKELRTNIDNETDKDTKEQLASQLSTFVDNLNQAIEKNTEKVINLASPAQVADLFYNKLGIPVPGDKQSVAKKEVKALLKEKDDEGNPKYPVVHLYSKYKNEDTLMTKFFDNLPYFMYPGGYIFSGYGQISTATGRMSCSKPNAQQYPKVITKIVSPRPGFVMMDADYSQIEYRVLTALAKNEELAKLFSHPDSDYHTLMASLMYDVPYASVTPAMRSAAKSFNFGIPYGMGFGSLAILLTGKNTPQTRDEAMEKYELYFKNQPRTRKFFDNIKEMAQINKYTKTLFNRYRYYSFEDKDGNVNHAKKAASLRQAGNAVIQGTAADIFKIGVARNFSFIRENNLFGKVLIVNMVHDEQLIEVDAQTLNVQKVLAEVGKNMQFKLDDFPPLYIGAGVGKAWGMAKGKMAEIHPVLLDEFTKEAESMSLFRDDTSTYVDPNSVVEYFDSRVLEFRRKKVAEYLSDSNNWYQDIHPAIGGLINLQFNYGRGDEAKAYKGPNGETYSDSEFLLLNIADFLKENNIDAKPEYFIAKESLQEVEEDKEYDDNEDGDDFDGMLEDSGDAQVFSKVDESDKLFGSSVHDLIDIFGACILEQQKICGINTKNMHFRKRDAIVDYLLRFVCDEDDDGALQIVFLTDANILKYTGIYVRNIKASEFEANYKKMLQSDKVNINDESYKDGDIDNRSQAK